MGTTSLSPSELCDSMDPSPRSVVGGGAVSTLHLHDYPSLSLEVVLHNLNLLHLSTWQIFRSEGKREELRAVGVFVCVVVADSGIHARDTLIYGGPKAACLKASVEGESAARWRKARMPSRGMQP